MLASVRTAEVPASPGGDADNWEARRLAPACSRRPIVFVSGGVEVGSSFAATGIELGPERDPFRMEKRLSHGSWNPGSRE